MLLRFALPISAPWLRVVADYTRVATALNNAIQQSPNGDYSYPGGRGLIIRTPDFLVDSDNEVVPATFWHNDIFSPSQAYPTNGDPWCPNDGWDGWFNTDFKPCSGEDIWLYAAVGYVVSQDAMSELFNQFDLIQDSDWGWGVFYPSDSNSVDQRCFYRDDYTGYECPGYWIGSDGYMVSDSDQRGPGKFPMGNPWADDTTGGGSGCHFDPNFGGIDQEDAFDGDGQNLVQDYQCQCNYYFNDHWWDWVSDWIQNAAQKPNVADRTWLNGRDLAPSWAIDTTACWVNNPRDLILLQNQIYYARRDWNNQLIPSSDWDSFDPNDMRHYWGWNEVPVTKSIVDDASYWDAVMIKLPANICGSDDWGASDSVSCMGMPQQKQIEVELKAFVDNFKLTPGIDHAQTRPGSTVVFVREWGTGFTSSGDLSNTGWSDINWQRWFFCENWYGPRGWFNVLSSGEECYVDWASPSPSPAPSPSPNPQPPAPVPKYAFRNTFNNRCLNVAKGDFSPGNYLDTWTCGDDWDQQQWVITDTGGISLLVDNKLCVDVPDNDQSNGKYLELWDCNGYPQQSFIFDNNYGTIYLGESTSDGSMCVDVAHDGQYDGAGVQLWDCQSSDKIFWEYGGSWTSGLI